MKQLPGETNRDDLSALCAASIIETVPAIMRVLRARMRANRPVDLSVPQFRTLAYIAGHKETSLSGLADYLGLSLPSASKLVDGLARKGLVARGIPDEDRRCLSLDLTGDGERALSSVLLATREYLQDALRPLDRGEKAAIAAAMSVLQRLFAPSGRGAGGDIKRRK